MDLYALLRVKRTSSLLEIKAAYRKLAFELHPDRNGNDPIKSKTLQRINDAYSTLSNTDLRTVYDAETHMNITTNNNHKTPTTSYHTYGNRHHPYANRPPGTYVNDDVWYAHHYGQASKERRYTPPSSNKQYYQRMESINR